MSYRFLQRLVVRMLGRLLLAYRDFLHARRFARYGLRRHAVKCEGQRFVYYEAGSVANPPVILLHGFLDRSFAFRRLIPLLLPNYRLILVDLPGHGASTIPALREAWTGPALVRSLYRFLRQICPEPAHLLTHSMGGLVALQMQLYAQRRGERPFLSLCAIAPGALLLSKESLGQLRRRFFPQTTEEVRQLLQELRGGTSSSRSHVGRIAQDAASDGSADEPDKTAEATGTVGDAQRDPADLPGPILQGLLHRWSTVGFHYLAENTMERPEEVFLTEKQMQQCRLPVTLLWGSNDRIVPLTQGRRMAKALRCDLRIVADAGHGMLTEKPDEVARLFEKSVPRQRGHKKSGQNVGQEKSVRREPRRPASSSSRNPKRNRLTT